MGKIKFKKVLINFVLFFFIILILGYNVYYFLIAPKLDLDKQIEKAVLAYDKDAKFLNVFSQSYVLEHDNKIVFVDDQGKLIKRFDKTFTVTPMLENETIEYGLIEDELILIHKNKELEVWVDALTSQEILRQEYK